MSTITQIPRTTVRLGVAAARLPLTAAEVVLGKADDEAWPPALAFETAEAHVEQVLGSLLRDEVLIDDGRLRSAKVARVREAVVLEAEAAERRRQADRTFEERRAEAEHDREEAERAESDRKAAIARDEAKAEAEADRSARTEAAAAAKAEQQTKRAAQRTARRAKTEALRAEEQALATAKSATRRARDAKAADAEVAASKATRRSSS